jgi:uncharacterized membrane protein
VKTSMLGPGGPTAARAVVAAVVALVAAVAVGLTIGWPYGPSAGWTAGALCYVVYTWLQLRGMSPDQTGRHATREDPGRRMTEALTVAASVASLAGVVYLLAARNAGASAAIGIASVVSSWLLVHTVYTLRYAEQYYTEPRGGIDFNQDEDPAYSDFAYLGFTLGMTYQVSDTSIRTTAIRVTALRHSLLSYLLGAVVLAATINLVVGLG